MLNKLKPTEYLIVGGGALVVVFGLLKWFTWEFNNGGVRGSDKSNAFDYLFTGVIPWLLIGGAALVTILLATGALNRGNVPWPLVILAATALGAVLILIRLIIGDDPDIEGVDVDVSRGIGLWISALGAVLAAIGAFLTYQAIAFDSRTNLSSGGRPQPDRELPPPAS